VHSWCISRANSALLSELGVGVAEFPLFGKIFLEKGRVKGVKYRKLRDSPMEGFILAFCRCLYIGFGVLL
jgi:hypothetical protein